MSAPRQEQTILTPSQVGQYIKGFMDRDRVLSGLLVRGELSNYKMYPSGHHYFTLKDGEGALRCVMFRGDAASLRFQDWRDLLQTLLAEDPAEPVSVTVISKNPDQSADVLENLEIWAAQRPGLHCGSLTSQEAQEAQSAGIPCWKYQIYLQAKSLYPD